MISETGVLWRDYDTRGCHSVEEEEVIRNVTLTNLLHRACDEAVKSLEPGDLPHGLHFTIRQRDLSHLDHEITCFVTETHDPERGK